jgi:hypothetical protein
MSSRLVNCRAGGPGRPLAGPASEAELPVDHLVYGASDLEAAVVDLEWRLGVRAAVGGQHQNLGTHNALLGEGCHLEVIAPDPTLPAPLSGRPFSLDSLERDRLVGWALRTRDLEASIPRLCGPRAMTFASTAAAARSGF